MKANWLQRITAATILPFHSDGSIDWAGFERVLGYCTTQPEVSSVFVNGHAGESSSLTSAERAQVIRFARRHVAAHQCLVAGLVASHTAGAVEQALQARDCGADVLTVFPLEFPGLAPVARAEAQIAHVRAIGEAVEMPLALFQYPFSSPATHDTATLATLAELPWLVGIKEGSDSMTLYEDNLRAVKSVNPGLKMLPSNFDWFLPQLAVGGDGILTGLASLAPDALARLWRASEAKDLDAMRAANNALYPLVRAVYALPRSDMYARIKQALHDDGLIGSAFSRTCKTAFGDAERAALRKGLAHARNAH
jgi:4-hydroxy-tetrahydrodipicolinate synthase